MRTLLLLLALASTGGYASHEPGYPKVGHLQCANATWRTYRLDTAGEEKVVRDYIEGTTSVLALIEWTTHHLMPGAQSQHKAAFATDWVAFNSACLRPGKLTINAPKGQRQS